jgi:hypothetical protein
MLGDARVVGNDLIRTLPVKHRPHHRLAKELGYVRDFFSVESLREAQELFERTRRKGNEVLYSDGGKDQALVRTAE